MPSLSVAPTLPLGITQKRKTGRKAKNRKFSPDEGKTHTCNYCDYTTQRKGDMTKHTRIHSGQKPFSCKQCGWSFTQSSHLRMHMLRKHSTDENPFKCLFCGDAFKTFTLLSRHKKAVHQNSKATRKHSRENEVTPSPAPQKAQRLSPLSSPKRLETAEETFTVNPTPPETDNRILQDVSMLSTLLPVEVPLSDSIDAQFPLLTPFPSDPLLLTSPEYSSERSVSPDQIIDSADDICDILANDVFSSESISPETFSMELDAFGEGGDAFVFHPAAQQMWL